MHYREYLRMGAGWMVCLLALAALNLVEGGLGPIAIGVGSTLLAAMAGWFAYRTSDGLVWLPRDQRVTLVLPVKGLSETARELGEKAGYEIEGAKAGICTGIGVSPEGEVHLDQNLLEEPWPRVRAKMALAIYDARSRRSFRRLMAILWPSLNAAAAVAVLLARHHPATVPNVTLSLSFLALPLAALWRNQGFKDGRIRLPHRVEDAEDWETAHHAY